MAETITETPTPVETELPSPTTQAEDATVEAQATSVAAPLTEVAEEKLVLFDPYEALDRAEMLPVLEQRDKRRERELRGTLDSEYGERTKSWEATQTANTLAGYYGNLLQKLADGDAEGYEKSINSMQEFARPLMRDFASGLEATAGRNIVNALSHLMSSSLKTRDRDEFDGFVEANQHKSPQELWPATFKEYVRLAHGDEIAKLKGELASKDDIIGRLKAEGRTDKGPNLAQGISGGSKRYADMTSDERNALSPQQRDAIIARELE